MKRIFGEINVAWQSILKSYKLEEFIIKDDKKRGEKIEERRESHRLRYEAIPGQSQGA